MSLGSPTYLFALAAIAIPIIIHLWSKNTKTKVPFGSLRFLRETETKTVKHLFPSEILLLVLRILLVSCLAILFTQPFIEKPAEPKTGYLVTPSIDQETLDKLLPSLNEHHSYWISPVRTRLSEPAIVPTVDMWTALQQFGDYDSLVVYSYQLLSGFHSEIHQLSSKINWVELPVSSKNEVVQKISKETESKEIVMNSSSEAMVFDLMDGENGTAASITVYMKVDRDYENLGDLITKAIKAINQQSLVTLEVKTWTDNAQIAPDDWIIWLSDKTPEIRKKLIFTDPTAQALGLKSEYIYGLNSNLTIENMLQLNIPLQLETALLEPMNQQYDPEDRRTIPKIYLDKGSSSIQSATAQQPIKKWILIVFLGLLLIERVVSQTNRKK